MRIVDFAQMAAMVGLLAKVEDGERARFFRVLGFDQEREVRLLDDDLRFLERPVSDEHLPLVRGVYGA